MEILASNIYLYPMFIADLIFHYMYYALLKITSHVRYSSNVTLMPAYSTCSFFTCCPYQPVRVHAYMPAKG